MSSFSGARRVWNPSHCIIISRHGWEAASHKNRAFYELTKEKSIHCSLSENESRVSAPCAQNEPRSEKVEVIHVLPLVFVRGT